VASWSGSSKGRTPDAVPLSTIDVNGKLSPDEIKAISGDILIDRKIQRSEKLNLAVLQ